MIPYGRQEITKEDLSAVLEVLESDYLTQGKTIATFEKKICSITSNLCSFISIYNFNNRNMAFRS